MPQAAWAVRGTPAVLLNDRFYPQPPTLEELTAVLSSGLRRSREKGS